MTKEELFNLEKSFSFDAFTNEDAFHLAQKIVSKVKKEHLKSIGIRVVVNGILILQYLMDGKKDDSWLIRKQKSVEKFKHSSYYAFLENQESGCYESLRQEKRYAICGGGFPIYVNDEIVGSFCVSGLAHQDDHALIVEAFQELRKEKQHGFTK